MKDVSHRKQGIFRVSIVCLALLLFFGLASIFSLEAGAKQYEISNYDIELRVEEDGDYLVRERLTYNFLEGSFSWAEREVPGSRFSGLEFVSLEGVGRQVTDYQLEEGDQLKVRWEFPPTEGSASFIIVYRARGGLVSNDGRNIVDWNPVGSGWTVPVKDIDVTIFLPRPVEGLKVDPEGDLLEVSDNSTLAFHRDRLSANTYYHLKVSFAEIIKMPEEPDYLFPVLLGLIGGLALLAVNIFQAKKRGPKPVECKTKPEELCRAQWASLYYALGTQARRGVAAEVFSLARAGKIKLVSKVEKKALGIKKTEVRVKVISQEGLNPIQKKVVALLEKRQDLQKFSRDYRGFKDILSLVKRELQGKGFISEAQLARKKAIYLSSIILTLAGIPLLVISIIKGWEFGAGAALLLVVLSLGRVIQGAVTTPLSGEGIYLQEKIGQLLQQDKEALVQLTSKGKARAAEALHMFFGLIAEIIIHKNFNSMQLNKYKKVFKRAEEIKIPSWLELDTSSLDETLDALDLLEVVDYTLITIAVIASNTGASAATGAGAAGSGAGGGGGSAG